MSVVFSEKGTAVQDWPSYSLWNETQLTNQGFDFKLELLLIGTFGPRMQQAVETIRIQIY